MQSAAFCRNRTTTGEDEGSFLVQARLSQTEVHQKTIPNNKITSGEWTEKKLGFPGNLACILGAPYMVTTNTDVSKKIANGTMCRLYDIILRDDAVIRIHRTKGSSQMHTVYADEIVCLLFHHRLAEFKATHNFDSLPLGCFPVITTKKPFTANWEEVTAPSVFPWPSFLAICKHYYRPQNSRPIAEFHPFRYPV